MFFEHRVNARTIDADPRYGGTSQPRSAILQPVSRRIREVTIGGHGVEFATTLFARYCWQNLVIQREARLHDCHQNAGKPRVPDLRFRCTDL